jgi:hypothetical protein
MNQAEASDYSGWSVRELSETIASDEGILRKEGDRCFIVDRTELALMKRELQSRWLKR